MARFGLQVRLSCEPILILLPSQVWTFSRAPDPQTAAGNRDGQQRSEVGRAQIRPGSWSNTGSAEPRKPPVPV